MIADRIERVTAPFGEEFRPSVKFLRSLLSMEDNDAALAQLDPKLRRAGIFEAIARFLRFASQTRPVIVVLEDLHWMDQATGEFLGMMVESFDVGPDPPLCDPPDRIHAAVCARRVWHPIDARQSVAHRQQRDCLRACRRRNAFRRVAAAPRRQERRQSVLRRRNPPIVAGARTPGTTRRRSRLVSSIAKNRCSRQRPRRAPRPSRAARCRVARGHPSSGRIWSRVSASRTRARRARYAPDARRAPPVAPVGRAGSHRSSLARGGLHLQARADP